MKTFSILLFAAIMAGSNLFKTSDATVASKDLTKASVSCSTVDTVIVPVAIQTSFSTKYPNATKVMWYQYTPDKIKPTDPTVWYYSLDDKDYYVTYTWQDADYIAWYDNGTLDPLFSKHRQHRSSCRCDESNQYSISRLQNCGCRS